ncbi:hypothetical protein TNCT_349361 [Trichonephila clavata]|uniref:Uncharacterized protein n=1 Tax=Trichonephila clavata TaxID=2740835 RepID=A0A8X6LBA0_TRICU|nr:hypothetical protein TNCT_349361 [Trichonephila clavata]
MVWHDVFIDHNYCLAFPDSSMSHLNRQRLIRPREQQYSKLPEGVLYIAKYNSVGRRLAGRLVTDLGLVQPETLFERRLSSVPHWCGEKLILR